MDPVAKNSAASIRPPGPPISTERQQVVERERQAWIKKLIDLSRRNNLLYFRPLKTGTLDLTSMDELSMADLIAGEAVAVSKLLGRKDESPDEDSQHEANEEEDTVAHKLREIARRALSNKEEKGLQTMFVALGMATWHADDEGRPADAPVLLLPVELEIRGRGDSAFSLRGTGPVQVNLVLLHVLQTEFGIEISPEDLLPGEQDGQKLDPHEVYAALCVLAKHVRDFEVKPRAILGNFAFQKMAMVRDLQQLGPQLAGHDMIAAIAGDLAARRKCGESQKDLNPREFDSIPPDNEFIIMDADSSQQSAMALVLSGRDAVVHGPPGTGKSQTIANLIASFAARGQRVLFVAEKRAALEVVLDRLNRVGLGHLAIDLHGADISPKRVLKQIGTALDLVRTSAQIDCVQLHERFEERRARLNAHVDRMHRKRPPSDETVYQLQGKLLRLPANARSETRWRGPELNLFTPKQVEKIRDLFREAGGFATLFLRMDQSPWAEAHLSDGSSVEGAIDLVQELSSGKWPAALASITHITRATGLPVPQSLEAARELFGLLSRVQGSLSLYSDSIFKFDLSQVVRVLTPAKSGGLLSAWAWCRSAELRAMRKQMLTLRTAGKAATSQLAKEAEDALDQLTRWRALAKDKGSPCTVSGLAEYRRAFDAALQSISALAAIIPQRNLPKLPLDEVTKCLVDLAADSTTPHRIPKILTIERELKRLGCAKLIDEIRSRPQLPECWPQMFDHAWWASCLDAARLTDPEIAGFSGRTHDQFVRDFIALDQERVKLAAARVQRAHAERAITAMNTHPNEEDLVRRESQKMRRLLPLRKLFVEAPHVITALCSCWMASPLSVSQLLDGRERFFDVVVFDEASQVLPEDAVPSIVRASQVVVAGDSNQLPPTAFFVADDYEPEYDEEEIPSGTGGFESLLDTMNAFIPSRPLDWHYRSRDESLISFSNHHIYGGRLVTFPGPGGPPALTHALVQQTPGLDGEEESSGAEVRRVVELILEHAAKYPHESLGVITMGIKHADRLQRALDQACAEREDVNSFLDPNLPERFFIKNLERVQGDERDAIILSVGYGKDRGGNLKFRFGPLLSIGGRRRLNVAVTRARQRLTLVSSFSHVDMDLARVRPGTGVELLRHYLQYAASSGKQLSDAELSTIPLNAFEAEVSDVLTSRGIALIPQMGASRFRIDLVAQHPRKPGRFVLAIECDGASYHSSPTARDRDRLRQAQLENLGWRFHRIWSTDWFMRKDEEVRRAVEAFHKAVEYADHKDLNGAGTDRPPAAASSVREETIGNSNQVPQPPGHRKPRPYIPRKATIDDYSSNELVELVRWIISDGQLRTDEQIMEDILPELGFSRRGVRIETAIRDAIRRSLP